MRTVVFLSISSLALGLLVCAVWTLPVQADGFAKSSYYNPDADKVDNSVDNGASICLDGVPEGDQAFYRKFFSVLNKYVAVKTLLTQALRANTSIDLALANYKQTTPQLYSDLNQIQDNGNVSTHVKIAVLKMVSEQVKIFENSDKEISSGKNYFDLVSTAEAKQNMARLTDIWLLIATKYGGMSPQAKESMKKTLAGLTLDERLKLM